MKIENLANHKKIPSLTIRGKDLVEVKSCTGKISGSDTTVQLISFPKDGTYFCSLKQDGEFGRFLEVTQKFYETLDSLTEKQFPTEFNPTIFKLMDF